ncbi:MAG: DUF3253 domain-containing protein [Pseudomonadota bacterium]
MIDTPDDAVRAAILRLLKERGPGKTICPSEAARALARDDWRQLMPAVHRLAADMARAREVAMYQKGRPVGPAEARGAYRLGLPVPQD